MSRNCRRDAVHLTLLFVAFAASVFAVSCPAAGWRNNGSGQFPACQPPTTWNSSALIWKAELPAQSLSSPTVVGDVVFTLAEPADLVCLSAKDGKVLWRRTHNYGDFLPPDKAREISVQHEAAKKVQDKIGELQKSLTAAQERKAGADETKPLEAEIAELNKQYDEMTPFPPPSTDSTGNTTSTPLSDGKYVWCVFATGIASCHDVEGNRQWMTFLEKPSPRHTSSPIFADGNLILHLKNLMAVDRNSGKVIWTAETPARMGTAMAVQVGSESFIVTPAGSVVRNRDGALVAEKLFDLPYCSPLVHENVIYAVERGNIKAIRLSIAENGGVVAETIWQTRGAEGDQLASPVAHDNLLYSVTGNGILEVLDAASGSRIYRKRLDLGQGRVDPSLALAGNVLFASSTAGKTLALKTGPEFEVISESELEGTSSSPFFQADRVVIRTPKHLYCVGKK